MSSQEEEEQEEEEEQQQQQRGARFEPRLLREMRLKRMVVGRNVKGRVGECIAEEGRKMVG